jgi:hypothetical protein
MKGALRGEEGANDCGGRPSSDCRKRTMGALASPRWSSCGFLAPLIGGSRTAVLPCSRDSADICARPSGPHSKRRNPRTTVFPGLTPARSGADAPVAGSGRPKPRLRQNGTASPQTLARGSSMPNNGRASLYSPTRLVAFDRESSPTSAPQTARRDSTRLAPRAARRTPCSAAVLGQRFRDSHKQCRRTDLSPRHQPARTPRIRPQRPCLPRL